MQNRDLRGMSRKDLLEILVEQQKMIERLKSVISEYEENEKRTRMVIDNAGSIAEAVISLNDVFGNAQKVADQYLFEIKSLKVRSAQQAKAEYDRVIEYAQEKASAIIENAENVRTEKLQELDLYVKGINQKINDYMNEHPEIREYMKTTARQR